MKLCWLLSLLGLFTSLFGDCDGFNWYHNLDIEECDPGDREALHQFINNSGDSLEIDMDINLNGEVEILELGSATRNEGCPFCAMISRGIDRVWGGQLIFILFGVSCWGNPETLLEAW